MTMARTSFLILPDGTIGQVWEKVNPDGHAAEVLAWLDAHPRDRRRTPRWARMSRRVVAVEIERLHRAQERVSRRVVHGVMSGIPG